jgi:hypothetical protein
MLLNQWAFDLNQAFLGLTYGLLQFLPNLIIALVIFALGWIIGSVLGRIVAQVVTSLRVDHALRSTGVEKVVERAGWKLNSGAFLGFLVKWFFIIVFLVAALQVVGLTEVSAFLASVVLTYLPHVIVAVLILLVAAVIADAVQRIVSGSAAAANIRSAHFVGLLSFGLAFGLGGQQAAADYIQKMRNEVK